jgi:sugar phosphate isomerase/epimerase
MYSALSPGVIGVSPANLDAALTYAKTGGFQGLELNIQEIATLVAEQGAEAVKAKFESAGIKPAGWGLPVDWRGSEDKWRSELGRLPSLAAAAAAIGSLRTFTWISPISDEKPLEENRKFHIDRWRPICEILAEYRISAGLEFIGPKTIRDRGKYEFIYKMGDMLDMCREIGPNAGLLIDCWHWYTSGGTVAELEALKRNEVVYVHVNDAPEGVDVDSQIDNDRRLPAQTGVIDIAGFLGALRKIGYEGPIVAEPFYKALNDLGSDEERVQVVGDSMDKIKGFF